MSQTPIVKKEPDATGQAGRQPSMDWLREEPPLAGESNGQGREPPTDTGASGPDPKP